MTARSKAKRRAPLMQSDTEAALRRRASELVGLVLLGLACAAAAMIWTYSPDDPSLFSATDKAPKTRVDRLVINKAYRCKVRAKSDAGPSAWSKKVKVKARPKYGRR